MIRNVYHELIGHVPGAVSPMIAAGRVVKTLHPDAFTVFIGPCMAKKKEAKEEDIADAIDVVLTFEEMNDIFEALGIDQKQKQKTTGNILPWQDVSMQNQAVSAKRLK